MDYRAGRSTLVGEWQEISRVSAWESAFRDWNTPNTRPILSLDFLTIFLILWLLLLLLFKKIGTARLRENDVHPISPKTPAPQYQPIDRKKRKGKRVEDHSRDRAAYANKEALALLLKPANPKQSNTLLARSFQRDTEKGIKVLLYCKVLQRGGA